MQKKKLAWNTLSSIIFQVTTIVCGFILPRLILQHFGSEVNGLVNSITQFLQIIAFLELGVGAVVQSSLYKPLYDRDSKLISQIMASAHKFFKHLASILLIYVFILIVFYPNLVNQEFGYLYTALLIMAMSVSSFTQYYFGMVNGLLLTADQRGYVQYTTQTVTLIINTIACVVLISLGSSILVVKLATSIIYLARPFVLKIYVSRHYNLNIETSYEGEPIKQKWNGVAQHIAAVILGSTDIVILTIFGTLTDVSIFSVYFLVVNGVKQLFTAMISGFQSLLGELWAKGAMEELNRLFSNLEWYVHTMAVFVWGCVFMLIVPFVQVYTRGVTDADYVVPVFAFLITLANAMHSLRLPYNTIILAVGHYKQTQNNYIIAAVINIVISLVTVNILGLVGVAIGTLLAMGYQTIWMAYYDSNYLLKRSFKYFVKQLFVDTLSIVLIFICTGWIELSNFDYFSWVIMAVKVVLVSLIIILVVNLAFYYDNVKKTLNKGRV